MFLAISSYWKPTHPHDVRILLELLPARGVVDNVAPDSRLGVFPDGRFASPAGFQRQPKLVRLDGRVPTHAAVL